MPITVPVPLELILIQAYQEPQVRTEVRHREPAIPLIIFGNLPIFTSQHLAGEHHQQHEHEWQERADHHGEHVVVGVGKHTAKRQHTKIHVRHFADAVCWPGE